MVYNFGLSECNRFMHIQIVKSQTSFGCLWKKKKHMPLMIRMNRVCTAYLLIKQSFVGQLVFVNPEVRTELL